MRYLMLICLLIASPVWPAQLIVIGGPDRTVESLPDGVSMGDIVTVYKDGQRVQPHVLQYHDVIQLPGYTVRQVWDILEHRLPETKIVNGEKSYWNDEGTWREVKKSPKYRFSLDGVAVKTIENVKVKLKAMPENQTLELTP